MSDPSPPTPRQRAILDKIAELLGADPKSVTADSTMRNHAKWDSYGHLVILYYLQAEAGIEVDEETLERYSEARHILELLG
jgi:acyl carrier protein